MTSINVNSGSVLHLSLICSKQMFKSPHSETSIYTRVCIGDMKMNHYKLKILTCLLLLLITVPFSVYCQKKPKEGQQQSGVNEKKMLNEAEYFFRNNNYLRALPLYLKLSESFPGENNYNLKIGICYLYKSDEYGKALEYLLKIQKDNPNTTDLNFFLGRAYFLNYKFDEAIEQFNLYLEKKIRKEKKQETIRFIENCKNGKELISNPVEVKIENIGSVINTHNSEYAPVISSDESVLIYTYRGEKSTGGLQNVNNQPDSNGYYFEDVFISNKVNGEWAESVSIGSIINGVNHESCIAMSNDGQKLFIFKNTADAGSDIYISHLDGQVWSVPEMLKGEINTLFWDGSISLSSDEKTVYFSSERPGGFGGRDIYTATLQPDGSWGNVKNSGSVINTPFDEDAPFIHPDGTILHFSSKGHNSIGGYDIFRIDLNKDSTWSKAYNLGYPINTIDDDIYYVLSADGKRGYYSSGKSGGYGQQDVYVVEPGLIGKRAALISVNGIITVDDNPVKADITVVIKNKNDKEQGKYNSNAESGKYLINLPAGGDYQLVYKIEGLEEQYKTVTTTNIDSFLNVVMDVPFFTKNYQSKSKIVQDSVAPIVEPKIEVKVEAKVEFKKESEVKPILLTFEEYLSTFGSFTAKDLIFRVQIGAFHLPEKFQYDNISMLGKVEKQKYEDGITRFTIGTFKTLKEANDFKNKIVAKSITDAFVMVIYKGKRISFKELFSVQSFSNQK